MVSMFSKRQKLEFRHVHLLQPVSHQSYDGFQHVRLCSKSQTKLHTSCGFSLNVRQQYDAFTRKAVARWSYRFARLTHQSYLWTKRIIERRSSSSPSIMFWILLILSLSVDTTTLSGDGNPDDYYVLYERS